MASKGFPMDNSEWWLSLVKRTTVKPINPSLKLNLNVIFKVPSKWKNNKLAIRQSGELHCGLVSSYLLEKGDIESTLVLYVVHFFTENNSCKWYSHLDLFFAHSESPKYWSRQKVTKYWACSSDMPLPGVIRNQTGAGEQGGSSDCLLSATLCFLAKEVHF